MGRCCVHTDTTVEEPNPMADWLGSWTAGCLLAESCHPIFLSQYPQVSDIRCGLCIGVFLHDTYRICAITCQSWGSWKGCSISEASNRSVRFLSLYIVSLACCQRLRWSISCFFFHMVFLFDLQKCGKILPSGVSSRFGSEDLSLYPPYSFSDHVKSWRLCIFIIVGKEDCFEILLLHAGECIPWKHNRWYSIWTAIRFPPPASYTVILFRLPFFSCIFMNLKVIFACYSIYAVYLAEGLDKYKSHYCSAC